MNPPQIRQAFRRDVIVMIVRCCVGVVLLSGSQQSLGSKQVPVPSLVRQRDELQQVVEVGQLVLPQGHSLGVLHRKFHGRQVEDLGVVGRPLPFLQLDCLRHTLLLSVLEVAVVDPEALLVVRLVHEQPALLELGLGHLGLGDARLEGKEVEEHLRRHLHHSEGVPLPRFPHQLDVVVGGVDLTRCEELLQVAEVLVAGHVGVARHHKVMLDQVKPLAVYEAEQLQAQVDVLILATTVVGEDDQLVDGARDEVLDVVDEAAGDLTRSPLGNSLVPHVQQRSCSTCEVVDAEVVCPNLALVVGDVGGETWSDQGLLQVHADRRLRVVPHLAVHLQQIPGGLVTGLMQSPLQVQLVLLPHVLLRLRHLDLDTKLVTDAARVDLGRAGTDVELVDLPLVAVKAHHHVVLNTLLLTPLLEEGVTVGLGEVGRQVHLVA